MGRKPPLFPPKQSLRTIECSYLSYQDINLTKLVSEAGAEIGHNAEIEFFNDTYFIPCFIRDYSLNALSISVSNYLDFPDFPDFKRYELALNIPCSDIDVQLFCAVRNLLIVLTSMNGWHPQMAFDYCRILPGEKYLHTDAEIFGEIQKGMQEFFQRFNETNENFTVDNNRLRFYYKFSDFNPPKRNKIEQELILNSICQHIWNPLYQSVDNRSFYVTVSTDSVKVTYQFLRSFVIWANKLPLAFPYQAWIIVEFKNGWKAIRYIHWKRILEPYFIRTTVAWHQDVIGILDEETFSRIKERLEPLSCKLKINVINEKGKTRIEAHAS